MPVQYLRLVRSRLDATDRADLEQADLLAEQLRLHLGFREAELDAAHVHNASSSKIQAVVSTVLRELNFREEVVLTPQDGFVTRARPDFIHPLGLGRGVIAEVERGGTVNNNHDLKDLWKTHIAAEAQHLFLVVPISNWTKGGQPRERPFVRVSHRLQAFFGDPRREIDVVSLHLFGYGRLVLDSSSPPSSSDPVADDLIGGTGGSGGELGPN